MSDLRDEVLLAAYREGDSGAFETLLGRYRGPIFNFLLRSVRDRGRAEELYQDVWMKVIERCDEFRGDAKFSTWLYTIARNLSIDHQRKMKFRGHASLDASEPRSGQAIGERVSHFGPSTEQLAIGGVVRERIARAVEALPEEQREVFLLRQLQGLAFREISEVVGVPANTVKSRMRYALERLRHTLSDLDEPHEV
ncbi:MAG: RNA polymerase sigma factor [Deltaproteobacteria bacterium]|nr:RNA polymerase sigma factor [Deltaproteobacteria bacterium]MBW2159563.1 RNA polymerase sigma factor [Deltaproteobacteria bacterium]